MRDIRGETLFARAMAAHLSNTTLPPRKRPLPAHLPGILVAIIIVGALALLIAMVQP